MNEKIKKPIWNFLSCNLPVDYDIEILRKIVLLNFLIIIGGIILSIMCAISFFQKFYLLCIVDLSVLLFLVIFFLILRKKKNHNFIGLMIIIIIGIFFFFLIAYGGTQKALYLWSFTYPLLSLFFLGARTGSILSILLLIMACIVFITGTEIKLFAFYTTDLKIRYIPAYITIFLFSLVMEKLREVVYNRLKTSYIELEITNKEKDMLIEKLQLSINEIKFLQGILPICSNCKKIRNDEGYWEQVEHYVEEHSKAQFSHGLCPDCTKKLYSDKKWFKG